MLPESLKQLSKLLARFPSVGPKSAERLALWFAAEGRSQAARLAELLADLPNSAGLCPRCGFFSDGEGKECPLCAGGRRNASQICIVEQPSDILDIEESGGYEGLYFVLGGVISPLEGTTISDLPFALLKERVDEAAVSEAIIALGATTEADVTSMYLKDFLRREGLKVTVPARGLAVGARISYAGKKSIAEAFRGRERL